MTDETEAIAEAMHDAYEVAASESGWETNSVSRVPWAVVPESNKAATRAAARAAINALAAQGEVSDDGIARALCWVDHPEANMKYPCEASWRRVPAVRALLAQAQVVNLARIAQLEEIQRDNEVRLDERARMVERAEASTGQWHDRAEAAEAEVRRLNLRLSEATGEVMEVEAENAALRAEVERVRKIHHPVVRVLSASSDVTHLPMTAVRCACAPDSVIPCRTLAALDGEP